MEFERVMEFRPKADAEASTGTPECGRSSDPPALDLVFSDLYQELRDIARIQLSRERPGHTLDSVAVVNEAYVKLTAQGNVEWQNRSHFRAIAARAMRAILIDYARAHASAKRGGGAPLVSLHQVPAMASPETPDQLLALDAALTRLAEVNDEACRAVECRYFVGLTLEEIAGVLGVSKATARRRWAFAKAWLARELKTG